MDVRARIVFAYEYDYYEKATDKMATKNTISTKRETSGDPAKHVSRAMTKAYVEQEWMRVRAFGRYPFIQKPTTPDLNVLRAVLDSIGPHREDRYYDGAMGGVQKNYTSIEQFDLGRPLGSGKFGNVYLVREKATRMVYAMKIVFKSQIQKHGVGRYVRNERIIHASLQHPNIIRYQGDFEDDKRIYIVIDYAARGDLYNERKKYGKFPETRVRKVVREIAPALLYLHSLGVVHQDLKPENVLISLGNAYKLTDFGYSDWLEPGKRLTDVVGTPDYLAPELVEGKPHDEKVDVWALGVLIYELTTGKPPFEAKDRQTTYRKIVDVEYTIPDYVSKGLAELIRAILKKDPSERMTLGQILASKWVRGE